MSLPHVVWPHSTNPAAKPQRFDVFCLAIGAKRWLVNTGRACHLMLDVFWLTEIRPCWSAGELLHLSLIIFQEQNSFLYKPPHLDFTWYSSWCHCCMFSSFSHLIALEYHTKRKISKIQKFLPMHRHPVCSQRIHCVLPDRNHSSLHFAGYFRICTSSVNVSLSSQRPQRIFWLKTCRLCH